MSDKIEDAIKRLQTASGMSLKIYHQPLLITFSGGKDSTVLLHLAEISGIPFEVQHSHTTADAPETVRFVRQEFKRLEEKGIQCTINYPVYKGKWTSMWSLIPIMRIPPIQMARYCCKILKEGGVEAASLLREYAGRSLCGARTTETLSKFLRQRERSGLCSIARTMKSACCLKPAV